jgi:hypothetical protein
MMYHPPPLPPHAVNLNTTQLKLFAPGVAGGGGGELFAVHEMSKILYSTVYINAV